MTATNHALTGAFIGLAVGNPWVAIPTAFVSHFVCDALPHFGFDRANTKWLRSAFFRRMLIADIIICFLIAGTLFIEHPIHWLVAIICAFVATSPDFYWIGKFRDALANKKYRRPRGFGYFASTIQWFQRPIGIVVEVAWAAAVVILLLPFIR